MIFQTLARQFCSEKSLLRAIHKHLFTFDFLAVVKCSMGGDMICNQLENMLTEQNIDLVPTYKIGTKVSIME